MNFSLFKHPVPHPSEQLDAERIQKAEKQSKEYANAYTTSRDQLIKLITTLKERNSAADSRERK